MIIKLAFVTGNAVAVDVNMPAPVTVEALLRDPASGAALGQPGISVSEIKNLGSIGPIEVNGFQQDLSYHLRDGDTVKLTAAKSKGGSRVRDFVSRLIARIWVCR